ncbi:Uncharacterised protein [Enterococcus durans]|uniref:Uncharacterized protein n=1 Tax=Enterococcus durans TaxID=53345 RepID=A0A377MS30_9ENTE|nr:hypothetical protein [Enterococcus durans]STQ33064.1 Uncharacterised protein [Enterococcus durans]
MEIIKATDIDRASSFFRLDLRPAWRRENIYSELFKKVKRLSLILTVPRMF